LQCFALYGILLNPQTLHPLFTGNFNSHMFTNVGYDAIFYYISLFYFYFSKIISFFYESIKNGKSFSSVSVFYYSKLFLYEIFPFIDIFFPIISEEKLFFY